MAFLHINNTDISSYIGTLQIDHEPIWNTSAGRTITGIYQGRIIARKWKINIATIPLSQAESSILGNLITTGDFVSVKFINPHSSTGATITKTFYVSPSSTSVYNYSEQLINCRYRTMIFNLIEQ